ncbi:hypothetical protein ABGB18_22900 [Nonomuraea sp. B12E4]|uniref:hypothetical protein n=1 Tax=Nonomuraea sp. B12E4 TaxID=3153564 RepID=UPI00325E5E1B
MTVRAKVSLRAPGLRQPMPLPTRSLLAWIDTEPDGRPRLLGFELDIPERVTLRPDDNDVHAEAEFWYADAVRYVRPSAEYRLWHGGEVGSIRILEVLRGR